MDVIALLIGIAFGAAQFILLKRLSDGLVHPSKNLIWYMVGKMALYGVFFAVVLLLFPDHIKMAGIGLCGGLLCLAAISYLRSLFHKFK